MAGEPELKEGDTGEWVTYLQELLAPNYYQGRIDADFGHLTHEAVARYQDDRGLSGAGVLNDATWESLIAYGNDQASSGLGDRDEAEAFVDTVYGVLNSSIAPDDLLDELAAAANASLRGQGCPDVAFAFNSSLAAGTLAEFVDTTWSIGVNPSGFGTETGDGGAKSPTQLADIANTIYHEAQHADTVFREARALAGLGLASSGIQSAMNNNLPSDVADAAEANPLEMGSAESEEGLRDYEQFYGTGAAETQRIYASGTYEEYRALGEEDKAFTSGGTADEFFREYASIGQSVTEGDRGPAVLHLQEGLQHLGFYNGSLDSDFGPITAQALADFQADNNVPANVAADEETWRALSAVYSG